MRQGDLHLRQLRMPQVRVVPDLVSLLRLDHLEGNRTHRRDGRELDETFGFGMAELSSNARQRIEACDQQACGSFAAGFVDHARIFVSASDGPPGDTGARQETGP